MIGFDTLLLGFQMHLGKATLIALLGIAIVFSVLALLVGLLALFRLVFNIKLPQKSKDAAVADNSAGSNSAVSESAMEDECEIAAVIAAVMAYMNSDETVTAPFRVTDIRKLK